MQAEWAGVAPTSSYTVKPEEVVSTVPIDVVRLLRPVEGLVLEAGGGGLVVREPDAALLLAQPVRSSAALTTAVAAGPARVKDRTFMF